MLSGEFPSLQPHVPNLILHTHNRTSVPRGARPALPWNLPNSRHRTIRPQVLLRRCAIPAPPGLRDEHAVIANSSHHLAIDYDRHHRNRDRHHPGALLGIVLALGPFGLRFRRAAARRSAHSNFTHLTDEHGFARITRTDELCAVITKSHQASTPDALPRHRVCVGE
jgi:hypothetical protein